jgi:protein ImuA
MEPREQRRDLIHDLRERISRIERSERLSASSAAAAAALSTGMEGLDRLLPHGGFEAGTLIEWLYGSEASGAATLALAVTARMLDRNDRGDQGGVVVVIDDRREFYPPAAADLGIPLESMVIVQPGPARAGLWALEQALRSRAVAVVLGWLGEVNDRVCRRLQLAAEAGGGLGFLLRPIACRAAPSWAEARLGVVALPSRGPWQSLGRRLRVELLHCRGGVGGGAVMLELGDEAGAVRVASPLADPALAERRA